MRERLLIVASLIAFAPILLGSASFVVSSDPDFNDPEESTINIQTLANNLTFTNVTLRVDETISFVEEADLSRGFGGLVTRGRLRLAAPEINIGHDITLGEGNFRFEGGTANLGGSLFFDDGVSTGLLEASRLTGTGLIVNVLSDAASIEQAVGISDEFGSVNVLDGVFGDTSVGKTVSISVFGTSSLGFASGQLGAQELLALDSSQIEIFGSGFEVDTGSGFASVPFGALAALQGRLRGVLDSGEAFDLDFVQGGGGFTGAIILVPEPSAGVLLAVGLAGIALHARRARRSSCTQVK